MSLVGLLGRGFGWLGGGTGPPPPAGDATIIRLTNYTVDQLNFTPFTESFTAERFYQPDFKLKDVGTLQVAVVPREIDQRRLDRARTLHDYRIDVGLLIKTDGTKPDLDPLMHLSEQIEEHFTGMRVPDPESRCVDVSNAPIFAPDQLEQLRVFACLLALTYRLWK